MDSEKPQIHRHSDLGRHAGDEMEEGQTWRGGPRRAGAGRDGAGRGGPGRAGAGRGGLGRAGYKRRRRQKARGSLKQMFCIQTWRTSFALFVAERGQNVDGCMPVVLQYVVLRIFGPTA